MHPTIISFSPSYNTNTPIFHCLGNIGSVSECICIYALITYSPLGGHLILIAVQCWLLSLRELFNIPVLSWFHSLSRFQNISLHRQLDRTDRWAKPSLNACTCGIKCRKCKCDTESESHIVQEVFQPIPGFSSIARVTMSVLQSHAHNFSCVVL